MALIGLGAQSEFQAFGFHALCGIRKLRVFDIDPAASWTPTSGNRLRSPSSVPRATTQARGYSAISARTSSSSSASTGLVM
jgi:ornithine cyclodeaminase/alanine dehydrogenase-like protein (mu-crystallin family)